MSVGGYRPGSGRSKSGYYKGIYCGSTYELAWVIYQLDHKILFERFPGLITDGTTKYIPDFLIDSIIIEIKGFGHPEKTKVKIDLAKRHGYDVRVLYKNDLKEVFDYVKKTYNMSKDKFHHLYDGYKPKMEYVCDFCGNIFQRDKPSPSTDKKLKFCGQVCSGRYRKIQNRDVLLSAISKERKSRKCGSRFTKKEALEIYHSSKSCYALAKELGISKAAIWFIKNKWSYKWIH